MTVVTALRQWPLAALLVVLAVLDVQFSGELRTAGRGWMVPGVVAVAALALLARSRPVVAALGAVATVVVSTGLLRVVGAEMPAGLAVTEFGALAAIMVAVVRQLAPLPAAGLVGLVLAAGLAAVQWRPEYWPLPAGTTPEPWWSVSLTGAAMVVLPVAYGLYLRGRDRERDRMRRAAVIAAQQRQRLELARELRDVVALQVGTMMERAKAAREESGTDPGAAARTLPVIERSGVEALSAMRRLVAALRDSRQDDGGRAEPPARTTDLAADLRTLTSGGSPPVRLTVDLAEPVPDEVAASVLRLVQESVTNARRHAAGAREIVTSVRSRRGVVRVEVNDDGRATATGGGRRSGDGLIGLRERVRLLGGRFTAGRTSDGWQVTADVPLPPGPAVLDPAPGQPVSFPLDRRTPPGSSRP